ncbi:MAG: TRAP transporter substrate-binding protein [Pseudomonadota bacterium]
MSINFSRRQVLGSMGAIGLSAIAPKASAAEVKLKISNFLPPRHGFTADFMAPWAKELEERTNGAVEVEVLDATSAFGKIARQADQVRAGVVDVALGLNGIPRDRYTSASIIELPFLVENASSGSHALWELYKAGALGNDYADFKVLGLFTHHGGLFHTIDKPVEKLEDLAGLRLRTPSPAVSAMLEAVGASPVGMPPAAIYENLQKGNLDGVITTWDLVGAIKVNELIKYHTDARAYVAGFHVVMNQRKFDSLPQDIADVIDEMSGDSLVAKFGAWWDKWDARGKKDAVERGNNIIEVSADVRNAWREQLGPMTNAYLEKMSGQGVKDPKALYARAQELVAKFDALKS